MWWRVVSSQSRTREMYSRKSKTRRYVKTVTGCYIIQLKLPKNIQYLIIPGICRHYNNLPEDVHNSYRANRCNLSCSCVIAKIEIRKFYGDLKFGKLCELMEYSTWQQSQTTVCYLQKYSGCAHFGPQWPVCMSNDFMLYCWIISEMNARYTL